MREIFENKNIGNTAVNDKHLMSNCESNCTRQTYIQNNCKNTKVFKQTPKKDNLAPEMATPGGTTATSSIRDKWKMFDQQSTSPAGPGFKPKPFGVANESNDIAKILERQRNKAEGLTLSEENDASSDDKTKDEKSPSFVTPTVNGTSGDKIVFPKLKNNNVTKFLENQFESKSMTKKPATPVKAAEKKPFISVKPAEKKPMPKPVKPTVPKPAMVSSGVSLQDELQMKLNRRKTLSQAEEENKQTESNESQANESTSTDFNKDHEKVALRTKPSEGQNADRRSTKRKSYTRTADNKKFHSVEIKHDVSEWPPDPPSPLSVQNLLQLRQIIDKYKADLAMLECAPETDDTPGIIEEDEELYDAIPADETEDTSTRRSKVVSMIPSMTEEDEDPIIMEETYDDVMNLKPADNPALPPGPPPTLPRFSDNSFPPPPSPRRSGQSTGDSIPNPDLPPVPARKKPVETETVEEEYQDCTAETAGDGGANDEYEIEDCDAGDGDADADEDYEVPDTQPDTVSENSATASSSDDKLSAKERRRLEEERKKREKAQSKEEKKRREKEEKEKKERDKRVKEIQKNFKIGELELELSQGEGTLLKTVKSGKLDFGGPEGTKIKILRKADNPNGKWLVRLLDDVSYSKNSIGYINKDLIQVENDTYKDLLGDVDSQEVYEEVNEDNPVQDELYEDV